MTTTSPSRYRQQHRLLDTWFLGSKTAAAVQYLQRYFRHTAADGSRNGLFRSRSFERLDGGGDREAVRDVITAADIVALAMLSIDIRREIVLELLGPLQERLSTLLRRIPNRPLYAVERETIGRESAAWELRRLIVGLGGGHNSVTASKLLARKRPALIPVKDSVIRRPTLSKITRAKRSPAWWLPTCLASWLSEHAANRRPRCARNKNEAGVLRVNIDSLR